MNKLIQGAAVILGLGLMVSASVNAKTGSKPAKKDYCYTVKHQEVLSGEWLDQLLVSDKKLTYKQVANVMKKKVQMSEKYDIEDMPDDECEAAKAAYGNEGDTIFYKSQAPKKKLAQQAKK